MHTFRISDTIKQTRDALWGIGVPGHWAGAFQTIRDHGGLDDLQVEEFPILHVGVGLMRCKVLVQRSKSFVQPDVFPPFGADKIAEPLMGVLVRNDCGNIGFSAISAQGRIKQ